MTARDPSFSRRSGRGVLSWLGLSPAGSDEDEATPSGAPAITSLPGPENVHRIARRQQLADITDFLVVHDLEITAFTLTVAHDYLSGADGGLIRGIDQYTRHDQPLTVARLEQICRETGSDQRAVLNQLMSKLESNIAEFAQTSTAAQAAASDYNVALAAQVSEMGRPSHSGQALSELIALARAMIDSTRSLEGEMSRSILQTRALRRSLEQARRSAEQDHLTGLPNRRAFEAHFASEYRAAREAGDSLCVGFCDIDNFKRINDHHGHEAGDRVLKAVAATLAHISDKRCHVARHGGEEFVVLLRGRSLTQAWQLLDATRAQLAERHLINRANNQPFGMITFSGGIADVFAYADTREALSAADKALFRAKLEGRNRILLAQPEPITDTVEQPAATR